MSFGNIVLLLIVGVGAYLVAIYNKFVSLRAGMDASWSDIDVQLKRRYDLIPALVDTVRGYKDYEADTLEKVIQARQQGLSARRYYNAIVRDYNAKVESFPDLFVAQKFNFTARDYFELSESEAEAAQKMPKIDL